MARDDDNGMHAPLHILLMRVDVGGSGQEEQIGELEAVW
eukprot:CAMPEP_0202873316 /NCGR_PEP_ID=MMETSP1391-20130828/23040_1 /ASSEMBLY_ACC=CAM_ASM_000867 /TAXON_ID=1034604 /ORGANISM="Chlamydomonas leiostraca, Strain SAG 11-49" /LENGTH=38 /DNA_ID= /DNA_START= /DNA_END= /DNA_ORIENTATION=